MHSIGQSQANHHTSGKDVLGTPLARAELAAFPWQDLLLPHLLKVEVQNYDRIGRWCQEAREQEEEMIK